MSKTMQQFGLLVIKGEERSFLGNAVRAGATIIEPFYAAVMRLRNWCFNTGLMRVKHLGRPTISVGNITTGGTGKTPVVLWLANNLRECGYRPAVLLRGYKADHRGASDEQQLLSASLNEGFATPITVRANASRVRSAAALLAEDPSIDVFILDDGFQHRHAGRDFDLVLISATEPFGYGHVLPRGLLREPLSGLRRASAFMITRSSQEAGPDIEQTLTRINPGAPVFRSDHVHKSVWLPSTGEHLPISTLVGQKVFLFAGIGDPEPFAQQLTTAGCNVVGRRWFADHHPYTARDISQVATDADEASAAWLITTRKDWVKIALLPPASGTLPIGVMELSIEMADKGGRMLLDRIVHAIRAT